MKARIVVTLVLAMLAVSSFAYEERPMSTGVRSLGMGGTTTAAGTGINVISNNPALLAQSRSSFSIQGSNFLTLDTQAGGPFSSTTASHSAGVNHAGGLFAHKGDRNWAVGFAYEPYVTNETAWAADQQSFQDAPYFLSFGGAVDVIKPLSFGLAVRFLSGSTSHDDFVSTSSETDYSGTSLQVGLTFDMNHLERPLPIVVGFSFRPPFDFESNYHNPWEQTNRIETKPAEYSAGLLYTPISNLNIGLDVDVVDPGAIELRVKYDDSFENSSDFYSYSKLMLGGRLGVEYQIDRLYGAWSFRGGLLSTPLLRGEVDNPGVYPFKVLEPGQGDGYTLGAGLELRRMSFDLAWASYHYWVWSDYEDSYFGPAGHYDQEYRFYTYSLQWTLFFGQ